MTEFAHPTGSVPTVVRIVKLDYDFSYALGEANGELEEGERPSLNDEGLTRER